MNKEHVLKNLMFNNLNESKLFCPTDEQLRFGHGKYHTQWRFGGGV